MGGITLLTVVYGLTKKKEGSMKREAKIKTIKIVMKLQCVSCPFFMPLTILGLLKLNSIQQQPEPPDVVLLCPAPT